MSEPHYCHHCQMCHNNILGSSFIVVVFRQCLVWVGHCGGCHSVSICHLHYCHHGLHPLVCHLGHLHHESLIIMNTIIMIIVIMSIIFFSFYLHECHLRVLHCQFHLLYRCGHMLNPLTSNYQSILHWNQLHYL